MTPRRMGRTPGLGKRPHISGHSSIAGPLAWLLFAGLTVGACLGPTGPAGPDTAVPSPAAVEPPGPSSPTRTDEAADARQTVTEWGRIWDSLPVAFPVYPGATPADDAATDVVSAAFALQGVDARTVVAWMQTELERATYATEALNGPLEDGGFILESVGADDCRIQVAVAPLGGLTSISVRYGADCPSP